MVPGTFKPFWMQLHFLIEVPGTRNKKGPTYKKSRAFFLIRCSRYGKGIGMGIGINILTSVEL
jgi:hypothetical protein